LIKITNIKSARNHLIQVSLLMFAFLFGAFITAPFVLADAGYTWIDDSTLSGNSGTVGKNWQSITSSANGQDLAATVEGGDIWTSTNGGTTWIDDSALSGNSATSGQDWESIASSANGQNLAAVVGFSGGIWTSTNGGTTWIDDSALSGNSATSGQPWSAIASSANGQDLTAMNFGNSIWTSTNGGTTWIDDSALSGNSATSGLYWDSVSYSEGAINASNNSQDIAAVAASGGIWTSTNGGTTWIDDSALSGNSATATPLWQGITSSVGGQDLTAVGTGDIWTSTNGGTTWIDDSALSGNSGTAGKNWYSVTSSSNGANLAAVAQGGDLWTAYDPSLVTSGTSSQSSNTPASTSDPTSSKTPDTGYGMPTRSEPAVTVIIIGAIGSIGTGVLLLYRQRAKR
jgi:hypothetical protein